MIESITTATLASLVFEKLGEQAGEKIAERFFQAKERYKEKDKDLGSPFELRRKALIDKLTLLQSDVILSQNQELISKLLPRLLELLIEVYEANLEQDLKFIELSFGRIKGALSLNRKSQQRRALARSLAIFVPLFALGLLGSLVYWSTLPNGPSEDYVIPIIQVPLPILVWSAIGSFAAILYRFNQSGDAELQDPLRWLFTRPLTGIVMGVIAYFVLKVGLLSFSSEDIEYGKLEILWLVAFIGGFSDRFADTILRALIGRFGGNSDADILNFEDIPTSNISSSLQSIVENFKSPSKLFNDKDDNEKNATENSKTDISSDPESINMKDTQELNENESTF